MPRTGGGGNTSARPSWICPYCPNSLPIIAPCDRDGSPARSSNGSSTTNMAAVFAWFVPVRASNPTMANVSFTPGVSSAIFCMRFMTASVRSSDAASGICRAAMTYPVSWLGMKPVGTARKPK